MPTPLEQTLPAYQFHERHSRWIAAAPEQVWQALVTLTLHDLTITRPLVALRHLGAPPQQPGPLLTNGPVQLLHTEMPIYAVGAPWLAHGGTARHAATSPRWRTSHSSANPAGPSTSPTSTSSQPTAGCS